MRRKTNKEPALSSWTALRCLFLFSWVLLPPVSCSRHQKHAPHAQFQQPQQAASAALGTLGSIVNEQNYRSLGFESLGEVGSAQLGAPIPVYSLSLDQLKNFHAGQDAGGLLNPVVETIYPISVGGSVRTGVTITPSGEGYVASSFGHAEIVRRIARYRMDQDAAVKIPAFNMYFVAHRSVAQILLTPIADNPRLKVKAGEAAPFETVVEQLRPYVESYDGPPK